MANVEGKEGGAGVVAPPQEPEKKTRNPFKKHKKHESKSDATAAAAAEAQAPAPFHSGEPTEDYYKIGEILGE